MQSLVVRGRQGVLSAAGIKTYRQHGLVVSQNFFSAEETVALTVAVRAAAAARGPNVFPGLDTELAGEVKFDGKLQPKPSVDWDKLNAKADIPAGVRAASEATDAGKSFKWRQKQVHLQYKNQRQVDRAYRRLARRRRQYGESRTSPRLLTDDEELAGEADPAKLAAAQNAYTEEQMQKDFAEYKQSGKLELQIRRENHINDTFEYITAWTKCWADLTTSDAALRALVLTGGIGQRLGEAAAALSGEVVVRRFADAAYESYPFMNATPMLFAATGANFISTTALSAMVGLEASGGQDHAEAQRVLVLPGSHALTLQMTGGGIDLARFQSTSVFDFGKQLRLTPELQGLAPVVLPPLAPGAVLFLHNFTVAGTLPTMAGSALSPFQPPPGRGVENPHQFSLSLMPDRCVFDGQRNSWTARDSHGPLYRYEKGQLLTDDEVFPVLHRALDIE